MLRDFIGERRLVEHAGRRYLVSPPTVETVVAALCACGAQLAGVRLAWKKAPEAFAVNPVAACLPFFADEQAVAAVLVTCVEMDDGTRGQLEIALRTDRKLVEALIREGIAMSDVDSLVAFMGLDDYLESLEGRTAGDTTADDDVSPDGPSALELLIVGIAERFHVEPLAVMRWPAGMFIAIAEKILPALYPAPRGQEIGGLTEAEWAAQGVTLNKPSGG